MISPKSSRGARSQQPESRRRRATMDTLTQFQPSAIQSEYMPPKPLSDLHRQHRSHRPVLRCGLYSSNDSAASFFCFDRTFIRRMRLFRRIMRVGWCAEWRKRGEGVEWATRVKEWSDSGSRREEAVGAWEDMISSSQRRFAEHLCTRRTRSGCAVYRGRQKR